MSFDVKNLFTQVPVEAALTAVEDRLYKDPTLSDRTSIPLPQLVELTSLCLRSTYFQLGEKFYKQTNGAAMHGFTPVPSDFQPVPGKPGEDSYTISPLQA